MSSELRDLSTMGDDGQQQPQRVFEEGPRSVRMFRVDPLPASSCSGRNKEDHDHDPMKKGTTSIMKDGKSISPIKTLLIAAPEDAGHYPVLLLYHGFLLRNHHYSQLLQHVASHGFILLAPQMYTVAGPDATQEIEDAAAIINWLPEGLTQVLESKQLTGVRPMLDKLALIGHSRGAKVAFGLALGLSKIPLGLRIGAIVGLDPVDGRDVGDQTTPPILMFSNHSFNLDVPILIVGAGLGALRRNALFPPCAPEGVNHRAFFLESSEPAFYFVASEHGHMDFLDDHTDGLLGKLSYCICRNGPSRRLMRSFSGGILVALCRATFFSDILALENLIRNPGLAPVKLEAPQWYTPTASTTSECPDLELVFSRVGSTSKLRA